MKALRKTVVDDIEDEKVKKRGQKVRWFNLNESRFKEEVKFMPNSYEYRLEQRLTWIDLIIDERLKTLPLTDEQKEEGDPDKKLDILEKKEYLLKGECRMQTKTQSFNMYESKMKFFFETLDAPDVILEKLLKDMPDYVFWADPKANDEHNKVHINDLKEMYNLDVIPICFEIKDKKNKE